MSLDILTAVSIFMTPCGLLDMSNTNVSEEPVVSIFSVKKRVHFCL
jgi:hypothetical protein